MKIKISSALALCLLGTSLYAENPSLAKLQAQLEAIQKEINALKAEKEAQKAEIADLQERTDENEFQAGLDKIKFGLDFSTGVSNTYFKVGSGDKNIPADRYNALGKFAGELHLNMNANINDYTKFYGRLSMAKYWGQMGIGPRTRSLDFDAGRNLYDSGSALYVSRAYVDLFFTPEFVATIGRQPGTEGPGSNLRNNALRQSTYPALLFNVLGDAAIFTFKPNALDNNNFAVRAGYGKIYQFDEEGKIRDWMANSGDMADADFYYGSAESKLPLESIGLGNNLAILSYAYVKDMSLPFSELTGNPFLKHQNNVIQNVGNLHLANLHFEAYNVGGSNFHYFTSFGYNNGRNAKDITQNPFTALSNPAIAGMTIDNLVAAGIVSQTDQMAMQALGVNTAAMTAEQVFQTGSAIQQTIRNQVKLNEEDGYSVHLGARYDFTQKFKLGLEYFYGSKYWYTLSRPSFNDPLNIRLTRGHAADLYGIYQFDRNQFFRLSYTYIRNLWGGRGLPIGQVFGGNENESTASNIMLMYNLKF